MIVVKREATDEEEDGEEVGNSSVELQQQPLKRIRNREDEATDAMKSSKMKTTGSSFHDEDRHRLRMKETESSSKGSINVTDPSGHSPPVVKTESRQNSPTTSVSSSEHNGIRSWSNQSSPNGHTTSNNNSKPIAGMIGTIQLPFITIWVHQCAPWKVNWIKCQFELNWIIIGHGNIIACLLTAGSGQDNQFYRSEHQAIGGGLNSMNLPESSCNEQQNNKNSSVSPDPDGHQQHKCEERSSRHRGSSPNSKFKN